jgi:hypothetical protein
MLQDGIKLIDGTVAQNLQIENGTALPATGQNIGELFYLTTGVSGLYAYDGANWNMLGGGGGTGQQGGGTGGITYTAGAGISISDLHVISSTAASAGGTGSYLVQIGDGAGGFAGVPAGDAARVLTSNGSNSPTWEVPQVSGGTVTSIGISGGATGLTASGAITTAGTITLGGTLIVEHGGTGAASIAGIIDNILPAQANHTGAALITDGQGGLSWVVQPGSTYSAGTGLALAGSVFSSTVADNTGAAHYLQVSNGDGTLSNLSAGTNTYVLTSQGAGQPPTWTNNNGTVTQVGIGVNPFMGLYIAGGSPTQPNPTQYFTEIRQTGTISLAGVLSYEYGGTSATTWLGAQQNLLGYAGNTGKFLKSTGSGITWELPIAAQTGNSGKFLMTDGTATSWVTPAGGGTVTSVGLTGAGLTFSAPITQSGLITVSGVLNAANGGTGGMLPIANGGTGATSAAVAINNLVPTQTGQTGKILTTDGTSVSWTTSSAGSVTSVAFDNTTNPSGLVVSGGPIISSGTFTLGGTLRVDHGGTGVADLATLLTNLLPSQAGLTSGFLSTNGTGVSWASPAAVAAGVLPTQTGNTGKVLSTDGTAASWVAVGGTGTVTSIGISGGTTGLSASGGPITTNGTLTLGGTLAVANGGTGAITAGAALTALLPDQATAAGKVLGSNGTTAGWVTGAGVTSVDIDGGLAGLTFSGGPITTTGTFVIGGVLSLAYGGTAGTSAAEARNNILPPQTTATGFILSTDGTNVSWKNPASLSNIANGATGEVQFNATGGSLGASSNFSWDNTNSVLTVTRPGGGTTLNLRSQSSTQKVVLDFGRAAAAEASIGLAGTGGLVFSNSIAGDMIISNTAGGLLLGAYAGASSINLDNIGNVKIGQGGYVALTSGSTERLRITSAGAWSVGSTGTDTGTTGYALVSNGSAAPPSWQSVTTSFDTLNVKPAVRVATTANITLSGTQTIDGVAVIATDRVLVKNQTTGSQNGIYVVASGTWTRSTDFDGTPTNEVRSGDFCFVQEGTANADTGWVLSTNGTITIGTTALVFAQFTGIAAASALSGTTLASNVVTSSLTSVGTLTSATVSGATALQGTTALTQYTELRVNVSSALTTTIDCNTGNNFVVSMGTDITSLLFTNVPASTRVYSLTLFIVQDATGSRIISWPAAVKWSGGIAPTLTTGATKTDIMMLTTYDGGSTWLGFVGGLNY